MISTKSSPLKIQILHHCLERAEQRSRDLKEQLADLENSLSGETKSSVGDKHETTRAKIHTAIDQMRLSLASAQSDLTTLKACQEITTTDVIVFGSFVRTSNGYFLIACGWGKLDIVLTDSRIMVFSISVDAPLFQKMKGLSANNQFKFNNNTFDIISVE